MIINPHDVKYQMNYNVIFMNHLTDQFLLEEEQASQA
jgi:hypothetical protein